MEIIKNLLSDSCPPAPHHDHKQHHTIINQSHPCHLVHTTTRPGTHNLCPTRRFFLCQRIKASHERARSGP